jgi:arsenite oxidase small subunit
MAPDHDEEPKKSRRDFLRIAIVLGGLATIASVSGVFRVLSWVPPKSGSTGSQTGTQPVWPRVKVGSLATLSTASVVRFNYPLVDTPNILAKLGRQAQGGVGPDKDIVAFSGICQHLGCFYAFVPEGSSPPCNSSFKSPFPEGYCCCHGGQYDLTRGAAVAGGPPPRPVPQVALEYDSGKGDIYAIGMGAPTIFGKGPPGTTDPTLVAQYDLEGGEIVTDATVFAGTGGG